MSPPAESDRRLPYPGLRSFQRDESDLFFGREGTVNEMINRLRPNHFLAVLGTSGSGKSSLVRIGLLDGLELGLLAEAGSSWRIADFAPGANPLRNLARDLVRLSGGRDLDTDFVEAFLARGPRSVIEWCRDGNLPRGTNLLLLVDQFEELFRYQDYAERQAAEAFVALLIESARSREVPIYVVITMRSEYLGACALIEGLAEIINDGQFLTPRLNRVQCREAIVGPAAVCGTSIEDDLVNRLLNDLEDFAPWDDRDSSDQLDRLVRRADQLPLLQHTLNRLWLRADALRKNKDQPIVLRLADYEAIGGLRGAINAHAEEILAQLGPAHLSRAEQVFRALTDGKSIATAVRRPTKFSEIVDVCGGDEAGARAVVEAFSAPGVNFLRLDTQDLGPNTIVDISHESLIRQWRRLSGWLQEEAREAQEWNRLGEAAARYRSGEGARYHGQDLHIWREHLRPTAAWASRYTPPYAETLAFLDESIRADRRQGRLRAAGAIAAFVVVVVFGGGGLVAWQLATKNAELTEQTDKLTAANAALEVAGERLKDQTAIAEQQRDEARRAQNELDRLIAEASSVFRASFDSGVGEYQHAGNWPAAGALLGALLRQTGSGAGADRRYNEEILSAVRLRLAEQWAFPVWDARVPASTVLTMQQDGMQRDGRYALSLSEDGAEVRLIDRLTGATVAGTRLPDAESVATSAVHLVTPDGDDAVIVMASGEVFRWRVRDDQLVDYGSLQDNGSSVRSLAIDRASDRIALLLHEEDSVVVVLAPDPPGPILTRLLSSIDALNEAASDQEQKDTLTFNGKAVGFWRDELIVSFEDEEASHRYFAAIGIDGQNATLLADSIAEVLPTPDGLMLVAISEGDCGDQARVALVDARGAIVALVDPHGSVKADDFEPACVGFIRTADDKFEPFGMLRSFGSAADLVGMSLADVWSIPAADGATSYRLVLDDGGLDPSSDADSTRFAVDVIVEGDTIRPAAAAAFGAADAEAPLALTTHGFGRGFIKATQVEPWVPLVPIDATLTAISLSASSSPIAEVFAVAAAPSAIGVDGLTMLALRPNGDAWPSDDIGDLDQANVARNADTVLVVADGFAGVQKLGAANAGLVLRKMTFGRECSLGEDETPDITTLLPWTDAAPVFFALDADGRVLRVSGRTGLATAAGGPPGAAFGSAGDAVIVTCIGQIRTDTTPIALADPAGERVLLQTNPLEFRVLSASVRSQKDFNGALRIPLNASAERAAFLPGPIERLAIVDKSGSLAVVSANQRLGDKGAARTVVVPDPAHLSGDGNTLLAVSAAGEAVVVDISTDAFAPVAAGRVPKGAAKYRLLADGRTVETVVVGQLWRVPLLPLGSPDELARFTEAIAGAVTDPSDQALVALGDSLTRGQRADAAEGDLALDADAGCFLAADALLEAWQAEAGDEGMPSARLVAARQAAETDCAGTTAMAAMGKRLAAASHFVSPALDPWPTEWSALLAGAISRDRLALRALMLGLANSNDAFASAAGAWLNGSPSTVGLVVPADVLSSAASGGTIDPALRSAVEDRRESYEPVVHELLGHVAARSGGERSKLEEAWVHYRIAEILYRHEAGRAAEADRMAEMRASLARALSVGVLLASWDEAGSWVGEAAMDSSAVEPSSSGLPLAERMKADAESMAAFETLADGDARFRLLQAYLWLNLADSQARATPANAPASYARFVEILTSLPPVGDLAPSMAAALADANDRLAELAADGRLGDARTAVALAPFMLGLAEAEDGRAWTAMTLNAYRRAIEAASALLAADPSFVTGPILDKLKFAARRFDYGLSLDDDEMRTAGAAALEVRLGLLDLLLARDPTRWDWLAAKGTTEFWIGFRLNDADSAARTKLLSAAIDDLSAARGMAGAAFPAESLYWLTEARRWLPQEDTVEFLNRVLGGIAEYAALRALNDAGAWSTPVDSVELLSSNAELLAKIADTQAKLLFATSDAWSPSDPAVHQRILDGLYYISAWDRIRRLAVDAGSDWRSTNPGYAVGPGYLLGAVGGRLRLDREGDAAADACDRLASFPADPLRRAPAVDFGAVDFSAATAACRMLWDANQADPRLSYLLGRLLWNTNERTFALDALRTAAEAGYAAAFNNLAGYLEVPGVAISDREDTHLDLRYAFAQRAVLAVFDDVYAWVTPLAETPEHRAGVRWLAERAAALGSAEAHRALAGFADTTPEDRAYHLEVAARIVEDDDEALAEEIRGEIDPDYEVDASDRAEDEWQVEPLVDLPIGLIDEIKGATN